MFSGNRKKQPEKPKGTIRCDRCGKKIRDGFKYSCDHGKYYCEKCTRAKEDWDFLEMMAILEER